MLTLDARTLIAPAELAAVTATVQDNNPGMDKDTAEQVGVEALAFVATAARNPGAPIAPSRIVDEGWHALILHTALYARLCERLGAFVHHYPERPDTSRQKSDVLERTVAAIRETGHNPDPELWMLPAEGRVPVAASCGHAPMCGVRDPDLAPGLVPALAAA
ncbi:glycine-rich domain-containing protein [Streptomyces sp.]|uniref:glycine-rich domain-containing protein n=1 Tax=Streptomyces sp. TaxID=1931 RepID=UPI002F42ACCA